MPCICMSFFLLAQALKAAKNKAHGFSHGVDVFEDRALIGS